MYNSFLYKTLTNLLTNQPFNMYAKFSEKIKFLIPSRTFACAYQGVNVSLKKYSTMVKLIPLVFLYPLKRSENQIDIFMAYRKTIGMK